MNGQGSNKPCPFTLWKRDYTNDILEKKTDRCNIDSKTSTQFNQTIVMITHNNEIAQLADRIVRIEDGKIVR